MKYTAHITRRLALSLCLCGAASMAFAEPAASTAAEHPCAEKLDYAQSLRSADGESLAFRSTSRCAGGLFVQDVRRHAPAAAPLIPLVKGWWLNDFVVARWVDEATRVAQVRARYITGAGPSGAQPFNVEVTLRWRDGAWQADEPQIREAGFDLPTQLGDMLTEAATAEQFENLPLAGPDRPLASSVDFTRQRVIVMHVARTHGAMRFTAPRAVLKDGAYHLGYDIGDTNVTLTWLWYIVPNDGRPVQRMARCARSRKAAPDTAPKSCI
ncbi:hypothetical protein [Denitromonas ohlonensis]|uniref:DUF3108 domain-containing protein n=2 Tax=Denitromonas TaxID=139331 RepID=A0A557SBB5_9RHOO|nr:hypothetical protein [Denitromonas ohlonensis]TVO68428.1 hypothetical protein FHP90_03885 [Denitromonas ohlonensis]TVO74706.1 hypothetical protein FHP89_15435 [Denitromonas ohlonensis]